MVQDKEKVAECLSKNISLESTIVDLNKEKQQTLEELVQVIDCGYFFLGRLHVLRFGVWM